MLLSAPSKIRSGGAAAELHPEAADRAHDAALVGVIATGTAWQCWTRARSYRATTRIAQLLRIAGNLRFAGHHLLFYRRIAHHDFVHAGARDLVHSCRRPCSSVREARRAIAMELDSKALSAALRLDPPSNCRANRERSASKAPDGVVSGRTAASGPGIFDHALKPAFNQRLLRATLAIVCPLRARCGNQPAKDTIRPCAIQMTIERCA